MYAVVLLYDSIVGVFGDTARTVWKFGYNVIFINMEFIYFMYIYIYV